MKTVHDSESSTSLGEENVSETEKSYTLYVSMCSLINTKDFLTKRAQHFNVLAQGSRMP